MQPLLKCQWYFSQKYKKAIINIVQNHNRPQTAKALLRKKKKTRGNNVPDFKPYLKVTVVKTAWYWHKN